MKYQEHKIFMVTKPSIKFIGCLIDSIVFMDKDGFGRDMSVYKTVSGKYILSISTSEIKKDNLVTVFENLEDLKEASKDNPDLKKLCFLNDLDDFVSID